MILGMTFQQAIIVGLVLTNHDYRYGLSAGHVCRTGFRASCNISSHRPVDIHNHLLVLLTDSSGLQLCDQVGGTKVS